MNIITRTLALLSAAVLVTSCADTRSATASQPSTIRSARTAYVIKPDDSSRDVEIFLKDAFSRKGLNTRVGGLSEKPSTTDLYVTFIDRWHWDMTMYLRTLDISVVDNRSGKEVATALYRNSALHGYPDPRETCEELVDLIYQRAD